MKKTLVLASIMLFSLIMGTAFAQEDIKKSPTVTLRLPYLEKSLNIFSSVLEIPGHPAVYDSINDFTEQNYIPGIVDWEDCDAMSAVPGLREKESTNRLGILIFIPEDEEKCATRVNAFRARKIAGSYTPGPNRTGFLTLDHTLLSINENLAAAILAHEIFHAWSHQFKKVSLKSKMDEYANEANALLVTMDVLKMKDPRWKSVFAERVKNIYREYSENRNLDFGCELELNTESVCQYIFGKDNYEQFEYDTVLVTLYFAGVFGFYEKIQKKGQMTQDKLREKRTQMTQDWFSRRAQP